MWFWCGQNTPEKISKFCCSFFAMACWLMDYDVWRADVTLQGSTEACRRGDLRRH